MTTKIGDRLGGGTFGDVYKWKYQGTICALKRPLERPDSTEQLYHENFMLQYLHQDAKASGSHIVDRIGFGRDDEGEVGLLLELCDGDLQKYSWSQEKGLSLAETQRITRQAVTALGFLQDKGVIHRDIKPSNILMLGCGATVNIKLTDFGTSTFSGAKCNPLNAMCQARWYRSPEIVLGMRATTKIDVWSLGATIAEIYCKKVIFPAEESNAQLAACHKVRFGGGYPSYLVLQGTAEGKIAFIQSTHEKVEIVQPLSAILQKASADKREDAREFTDLLDKMFIYDPEKRIAASEISKHPFLTNTSSGSGAVLHEAKKFAKTYRNWTDEPSF